MSNPVVDPVAARLEADLRLRFPEIVVRFARTVGGEWVCRVVDAGLSWGTVATSFDDREALSPRQKEQLLAEVAIEVADNLWPDELTDPWPLCPRHGDHPLQAQFLADQAVWLCLRDPNVAVPVGALRRVLNIAGDEAQPLIEYVGFVWKGNQPRIDFKIQAKSLQDAKREVLAQYGEDFAVSIWNEDDASRPR